MTLMLLFSVSMLAQPKKYTVSMRENLADANKNGDLQISPQNAEAGTRITVTVDPKEGYGLARGVYYATVKNGVYSVHQTAKCESSFPDDRANEQIYRFDLPAENVEVWAYFDRLRSMKIHSAPDGYLKPLYGLLHTSTDTTTVYNVPSEPIKLQVKPNTGYELVDVDVTNIDRSRCKITSNLITVYMPNEADMVHITPIFGKNNYHVTVTDTSSKFVKVALSNSAPKSREEVVATLTADAGYIPTNITITGCKSWWRVGKPQLGKDGKWQVVYHFKVDLQDVTIDVSHEQVNSFTITDTESSGRLQAYAPELIPDFPGVARKGQQIPVLFKMPADYSVTYTATDAEGKALTPQVYHNALENSFAEKGMMGWTESNDYLNNGLPIRAETDADGNKYWRTSVKNSMSQMVSLADYKKTDTLSVAAIASINPRRAPMAEVCIVPIGKDVTGSELVVADLKNKPDGWQTVFKTGEVDAKADTLEFVVRSEADDPNNKYSYDGPMFADLCLLLPTSGKSIKDEDVLVFTMGDKNVSINFTGAAEQNTVVIDKQKHVTVTLHNVNTDEQGDTVKAMKDDIIVVKGKADEGYAIYDMQCRTGEGPDNVDQLLPDSLDLAKREVFFHFIKGDEEETIVTPVIDTLKVCISASIGGVLEVDNEFPREGDKVVVTITSDPGCKLKQIRTFPEGLVTFKADSVDAATGAGRYSFVMPTTYLKLTPEFIVPISTAKQFEKLSQKYGEFNLVEDIDLGKKWNKTIKLAGQFNGNGHRITYGGSSSLFHTVLRQASVRHLYVTANVKGSRPESGGIAMKNKGIIEDCVVTGTIRNTGNYPSVGGIAGQNLPDNGGAIIAYCHVLCDEIDGRTASGIAGQNPGATIKNNLFSGKFTANDGQAYMICNDPKNSTIENNYYMANDGNARATVVNGVTAIKADDLVETVQGLADQYPVYVASIRNKYKAYTITTSMPAQVTLSEMSSTAAGAGSMISGSVKVSGNNHLESITISAPDGSDAQVCPFTDNTVNDYFFSFTMPDHDVLLTFKTEVGTLIYTAKQLAAIHLKKGKYILARDIELDMSNWKKKVHLNGNLYGNGHAIKFNMTGSFKGVFTKIWKNATIEGVRFMGFAESDVDCGGITYENQGTIRDCHFVGNISRVNSPAPAENRVAAIAFTLGKNSGLIDHCSATGELISPVNQAAINASPLCAMKDANVTNSHWISATQTTQYQELLGLAKAASSQYPVYAQGIYDKITPRIIVGSDTTQVANGQTLDELTIIDGKPFVCTGDVKVNRIIYKRQAMNSLEPWILPFEFNQIAGSGQFEYRKVVEDNKMPDIGAANQLTLSNTPSSISYKAQAPWMVKNSGSGEITYVLTNANGPITVKATYNPHIAHYASILDIGTIYATYDSIPLSKAKEDYIYAWADAQHGFLCCDSNDIQIQPYRFYLQFFRKGDSFEKYYDTTWAKNQQAGDAAKAPQRRASEAIADGWQPVFLDPRTPQSVTARMLDYYEVAYLTDIRSDVVNENAEKPLSAVSLVYQMVDSRMDLPSALPLLVRAKRPDAMPLTDEKAAAEIDSLYILSILSEMIEDEGIDDIEVLEALDSLDFEMPHYWCGSFGNRLDIWPLPLPEKYADLAEYGGMVFSDNYFDQSFVYAAADDTRSTDLMSYCVTLLNSDSYESLSLMGDRVYVQFIQSGNATGIENVTSDPSPRGEGSGYIYNLSGQRVGAGYKGIIVKNGRKLIKR